MQIRRPLTAALAAAGRGEFVLDGVPRMRERPIQDLIDGLNALGVDARCTLGTGCPPVAINAQGLKPGKVQSPVMPPFAKLHCADSRPCRHARLLAIRFEYQ